MRNLDWLYEHDDTFRETVNQGAADWLGSTSLNFAGAWLMEQHKYEHHDSDYEDLIGQHLDGPCVVPNRDEQVDMVADLVVAKIEEQKLEMLRNHCADQAEQLRRLTDENAELRKLAEKYRAGSVAAQEEAEAWRTKCGALLDAAHEMIRIGGDVA